MTLKPIGDISQNPYPEARPDAIEQFRETGIFHRYIEVRKNGMPWIRAFRNAIFEVPHLLGHFTTKTKPLKLEMTFWMNQSPLKPPDIDNLVKGAMDTIMGSSTDNCITTLIAHKKRGSPAIDIFIEPEEANGVSSSLA